VQTSGHAVQDRGDQFGGVGLERKGASSEDITVNSLRVNILKKIT
jgi:hypothetical protein